MDNSNGKIIITRALYSEPVSLTGSLAKHKEAIRITILNLNRQIIELDMTQAQFNSLHSSIGIDGVDCTIRTILTDKLEHKIENTQNLISNKLKEKLGEQYIHVENVVREIVQEIIDQSEDSIRSIALKMLKNV
jgi:hypothetical protein